MITIRSFYSASIFVFITSWIYLFFDDVLRNTLYILLFIGIKYLINFEYDNSVETLSLLSAIVLAYFIWKKYIYIIYFIMIFLIQLDLYFRCFATKYSDDKLPRVSRMMIVISPLFSNPTNKFYVTPNDLQSPFSSCE